LKKLSSLLLALILVVSVISLSACGGGEESNEIQTPSTSEPAKAPEKETATTPSTESLSWNDMPIYSGAKQVQKGSWSIPPSEGDYSKVEWRYYESGDDLDTIAAFYKSQMPAKGWEEMGWMEVLEMSWGLYNKNDENDTAMVWMALDEGKGIIALMRASK